MKIYISGKITGLSDVKVCIKFSKTYYDLMFKYRCKIINPYKIKPLFGIKKWFCYMVPCIFALLKCDTILLQPDWIDSRGAKIELIVAILTKKKIIIEK